MTFYHVTFDRHLPSIERHGLGGAVTEKNWTDCADGVYLALAPSVGLLILIEWGIEHCGGEAAPSEFLKTLRVIVIDDTRVDVARLRPDPQAPDVEHVRLYDGVIDVSAMPVLTVDQALAGSEPVNGAAHASQDPLAQ